MSPALRERRRRQRAAGGLWLVLVTMGLAHGGGVAFAASATKSVAASPPAPIVIVVAAAVGSRLAEELSRELRVSGFAVRGQSPPCLTHRSDQTPDRDFDERATAIECVIVGEDDETIAVFTRTFGGAVEDAFEQRVDPRDRMARRRACIVVTEYLRALIEQNLRIRRRTTGPPEARAEGAASPKMGEEALRSKEVAAATEGAEPTTVAEPMAVAEATVAPESDSPPTRGGRSWELGLGTLLDVRSAPGGPTAHAQFLWNWPVRNSVVFCVRGLWPLLGSQFRTAGEDVRSWTFGGDVGAQYRFQVRDARVQPFLGFTVGPRVALTEVTPVSGLQTNGTFTPNVSVGAVVGLSYSFNAWVRLLLAAEGGRGWLIPTTKRAVYEVDAANARSVRASIGLIFQAGPD